MAKRKTRDRIVLAHGGGGELTLRLLEERILPKLGNALLDPLMDSAVLTGLGERVCLTTDSFVVQPLEFPGGDIGTLAVCGTVNDLAVMGATPKALSLALVLEEGLELELLDRIVDSIAASAKEAGVAIATGDTKVIEYGRGDGLTITTTGVGALPTGVDLSLERIATGDVIIINGYIAEHGLAVMSAREGLAFDTELKSDVAPLNGLVGAILDTGADVKFMRDPTRSGLSGVLCDIAETTHCNVEVDEESLPLSPVVRHTAEMLGLDPLTVANEGKCVCVVSADGAEAVLAACRAHPLGERAVVVGKVAEEGEPALVELVTWAGGRRLIQRPYGEDLPRIC